MACDAVGFSSDKYQNDRLIIGATYRFPAPGEDLLSSPAESLGLMPEVLISDSILSALQAIQ
jgi:hypothetical protein